MNSQILRRGKLPVPTDRSATYWSHEATRIFCAYPKVQQVEIVHTGRKTDSVLVPRGAQHAPLSGYLIVASTRGKWGKSRQDFPPVAT